MEETYRTYHGVFSFIGIPIFASKNWSSKFWLIFQTFDCIIGILCFICTTLFVVTHSSDFPVFIESACICVTGVIMTLTLILFLLFRSNFRSFIEEMGFQDFMQQMPLIQYVLTLENGGKLLELKNLVNKSQQNWLKFTNYTLKYYLGGTLVVCTLYVCSPIYLMAVRKDEDLRLLAFGMWFPWSLKDMRVYVASFIFHAYCGYLCCFAYPAILSLLVLLFGQVIRQLRIITFILLNLDELVTEFNGANKDGKWQVLCTSVLTQCIHHYAEIKKFINRLNVICQPFYLTMVLIAIMIVCMCSVKIAVAERILSFDTMKFILHEFYAIMVVLMLCLLGQQVANECDKLQSVVTEKWYIFDKKHKKTMLIFMMGLGQNMPIYIFGTITLCLPTFTWFIKTGSSFFTLVMSLLDQEEGF